MLRSFAWMAAGALALALGSGGCGDDGNGDGGDPMVDAGVDAGPLMSEMFGPCNANADCVDTATIEQALCRPASLGFAAGSCSRRCGAGGANCRDAEFEHECLDDDAEVLQVAGVTAGIGPTCYRICSLSAECTVGETCLNLTGGMYGFCVPWSCGPDQACAGGAECGPNGLCGGEGNPGGAAIGTSCTSSAACESGICFQGQCSANCELPVPGYNAIEFYTPQSGPRALPSGSCPEDDVCFPLLLGLQFRGTVDDPIMVFRGGNVGRRDPGRCRQGCEADGDCPTGNYCVKEVQVGTDINNVFEFTRGACYPRPSAG